MGQEYHSRTNGFMFNSASYVQTKIWTSWCQINCTLNVCLFAFAWTIKTMSYLFSFQFCRTGQLAGGGSEIAGATSSGLFNQNGICPTAGVRRMMTGTMITWKLTSRGHQHDRLTMPPGTDHKPIENSCAPTYGCFPNVGITIETYWDNYSISHLDILILLCTRARPHLIPDN